MDFASQPASRVMELDVAENADSTNQKLTDLSITIINSQLVGWLSSMGISKK